MTYVSAGGPVTSIDVVIATFRRPDRLTTALRRLQSAAEAAPSGWTLGVTIVDDDPSGSAAPVADHYRDRFPGGITYLTCGSRNISLARNMGLESALPRADWVGSIDDDVEVPPDWVSVCAEAVDGSGFNAVTGPLLKDFSAGPRWLSEQPFDQLGILAGADGQPAFTLRDGQQLGGLLLPAGSPDPSLQPRSRANGG